MRLTGRIMVERLDRARRLAQELTQRRPQSRTRR
jgi:hypothetical protein